MTKHSDQPNSIDKIDQTNPIIDKIDQTNAIDKIDESPLRRLLEPEAYVIARLYPSPLFASAAISLKRMADSQERCEKSIADRYDAAQKHGSRFDDVLAEMREQIAALQQEIEEPEEPEESEDLSADPMGLGEIPPRIREVLRLSAEALLAKLDAADAADASPAPSDTDPVPPGASPAHEHYPTETRQPQQQVQHVEVTSAHHGGA